MHLGIEIGEGQLVLGQGLEQALFDAARHVDRIDHHDVPVAGLRLVDDGEAGAGALELLDVDLDAIGILEGLEQSGVGMVAPDQGVELRRRGGGTTEGQQDSHRHDGATAKQNGSPKRQDAHENLPEMLFFSDRPEPDRIRQASQRHRQWAIKMGGGATPR